MNLWRKLNHLVPEPKCRVESRDVDGILEEKVHAWTDERPQPTQIALDNIQESDLIATELDKEASLTIDSDKFKKLLFEINFDQENRLRVLEGNPPITKAQYRAALISQYKDLS